MASTRGRKALPLPPSLLHGLQEIGYVDSGLTIGPAGGETPLYRHQKHPELYVIAVMGNLPGATEVTAFWTSSPKARRVEVDFLLASLTLEVVKAASPVRTFERGPNV